MNFKLFVEASTSKLKEKILNSQFFRNILARGGKPYFVGGAIRDFHLNKESKDIDIIISGIPANILTDILRNYGRVDEVGESFGVIKFKPFEFEVDEPIDIALPRTERPMNQAEKEEYKKTYGKYPSAYQAFKTSPDHALPVHHDLGRRDFTINAIAQDHLGNSVDPYNGVEDIKDGKIRMVDRKVFAQDPLRMLRGVQFASRFGFEIEPETFKEIKDNAKLINGIPGERILVEIEKIVNKGDQYLGADLLCSTNLWQEISGLSCSKHKKEEFDKSKEMSEFLFLMMYDVADVNKALQVCKRLKCEIVTEKQMKALYLAWTKKDANPHSVVFELNRIHPSCLTLNTLPENIKDSINSDMPKSFGDLDISGDDLIKLGHKGEKIGVILKDILAKIFDGKLRNKKEDIMDYLKPLNEIAYIGDMEIPKDSSFRRSIKLTPPQNVGRITEFNLEPFFRLISLALRDPSMADLNLKEVSNIYQQAKENRGYVVLNASEVYSLKEFAKVIIAKGQKILVNDAKDLLEDLELKTKIS